MITLLIHSVELVLVLLDMLDELMRWVEAVAACLAAVWNNNDNLVNTLSRVSIGPVGRVNKMSGSLFLRAQLTHDNLFMGLKWFHTHDNAIWVY